MLFLRRQVGFTISLRSFRTRKNLSECEYAQKEAVIIGKGSLNGHVCSDLLNEMNGSEGLSVI